MNLQSRNKTSTLYVYVLLYSRHVCARFRALDLKMLNLAHLQKLEEKVNKKYLYHLALK